MHTAEATLDCHPIDGSAADFVAALAAEGLPTDDLADAGRVFFRFADRGGGTVGFGGYELYAEDVLLRSIVVVAGRGRGRGKEIVASLTDRAMAAGAKRAFLITASAGGFFERAGFVVLPRDAAPAAILATRQAAGLCAKSAPLLTKSI